MKYVLNLCICLLLYFTATAQHKYAILYNDSTCNMALRLKKAYSDLKFQESTATCKQAYFTQFPTNFFELYELFGYQEQPQRYGILFYDYVNLVPEFFNDFFYSNDTVFYEKMIVTSMGGKWYNEGINMFQQQMRKEIKNNAELSASVLDKFTDNDIMDFWKFYFDGPSKPIDSYDILKNIKQYNERVYNDMLKINPDIEASDTTSH